VPLEQATDTDWTPGSGHAHDYRGAEVPAFDIVVLPCTLLEDQGPSPRICDRPDAGARTNSTGTTYQVPFFYTFFYRRMIMPNNNPNELPPIEGELTDEDLKQVSGGCLPFNSTVGIGHGQNQQGQNCNNQGQNQQ
jgi:hypothetical protein